MFDTETSVRRTMAKNCMEVFCKDTCLIANLLNTII